jgi:ribosomal-protein-alanine N-acetyltransferase
MSIPAPPLFGEGRPTSVAEAGVLVLRPMRELDLSDVLAVESAAYEFPWTHGVFRDCLRVGYCCWVGLTADGVVAHGIASVAAGESHILNLCVAPAAQGHGFGRVLLRHLLSVVRRHGAAETFLEVRPSNEQAVSLYESSGFRRAGFRKNYYPGSSGREDALVMALSLADPMPK